MSLLTKLSAKMFNNNCQVKDEIDEKVMFIDNLSNKILNSEGVHYYLTEENRVEQANIQGLVACGASFDFANALSKCVKFIRSKSLYLNFGEIKMPVKQIKASNEYIDDIVIGSAMRFFNEKNEFVYLCGKMLCAKYSLNENDQHLLEFANYVVMLNAQIQAMEWYEQKIDSLNLARRVKVEVFLEELKEKENCLK